MVRKLLFVALASALAGCATAPQPLQGEYDYRYPRVAADVVYLWPERREREFEYRPYFPGIGPLWYDPWYRRW